MHAQGDLHRAVPPAGKALVFVYRVDRTPVAAQVPVLVNNELVGNLANGTFVTATVDPGTTHLRIGDRLVSALSITTVPDQSYFFQVNAIPSGALFRTEVNPASEPEGRQAIAQSRFVGVAPAPPAEPAAAQAAAAPTAAAAGTKSNWSLALVATAGSFKLSNGSQTVAGLASTYDTTSDSVISIQGEFRHRSGFAWGLEYFAYQNDLVTTGSIPNSQQKVYAVMLNAKNYFRAGDGLYPFFGMGVGQANASYTGGLTGNASGFAYQGMVGMEIRFKWIGLYAQYKYLGSKVGSGADEVKVGGSGVLGGISILF